MTGVIGILVLGGIVALAARWRVRDGRRRADIGRDDTLRAGESASADPDTAARRAEGTTAWTRISGS